MFGEPKFDAAKGGGATVPIVYIPSGKLHKDYTVYEDVKSILPIYIHVYPVRPCRDDLCEIIPSI